MTRRRFNALPGFGLTMGFTLFYLSLDEAVSSLRLGEVSDQTPWRPYLWPYKTVIPLACLFLMIQGISELLKSFYMARTGIERFARERGVLEVDEKILDAAREFFGM